MTATPEHVVELARLYVFVTLAAAAAGKALATGPFVVATATLTGLSRDSARPLAYAVVAAEAAAAALVLASGGAARLGMAAALTLLLAFSVAIATALALRRTVRCNCFGGGGHPVSSVDLVRNASLIAAATLCLIRGMPGTPLESADFALNLGIATILFLVSANLREIAAVARAA